MTGRGSKSGRAAVGPLPWLMWSLGALFFCYVFFQRVAPSVLVSDLMRDFGVGAAVLEWGLLPSVALGAALLGLALLPLLHPRVRAWLLPG